MRRFAALIPLVAFALPLAAQAKPKAQLDTAVFAGGCFWGVEGVFDHVKGVTDAMSGFAGGHIAGPSYEEVSTGETGHAESVRVIYDPAVVSYGKLLQVFFSVAHDPTELNRQGPDAGTQYRSAIFYHNDAQKSEATAYIAQLSKAKFYSRPIVTEVTALGTFYPAEAYHQNYMAHNPHSPYIMMFDAPKVENLRKEFPDVYREPSSR